MDINHHFRSPSDKLDCNHQPWPTGARLYSVSLSHFSQLSAFLVIFLLNCNSNLKSLAKYLCGVNFSCEFTCKPAQSPTTKDFNIYKYRQIILVHLLWFVICSPLQKYTEWNIHWGEHKLHRKKLPHWTKGDLICHLDKLSLPEIRIGGILPFFTRKRKYFFFKLKSFRAYIIATLLKCSPQQ